jgi:hypothetical protein
MMNGVHFSSKSLGRNEKSVLLLVGILDMPLDVKRRLLKITLKSPQGASPTADERRRTGRPWLNRSEGHLGRERKGFLLDVSSWISRPHRQTSTVCVKPFSALNCTTAQSKIAESSDSLFALFPRSRWISAAQAAQCKQSCPQTHQPHINSDKRGPSPCQIGNIL